MDGATFFEDSVRASSQVVSISTCFHKKLCTLQSTSVLFPFSVLTWGGNESSENMPCGSAL